MLLNIHIVKHMALHANLHFIAAKVMLFFEIHERTGIFISNKQTIASPVSNQMLFSIWRVLPFNTLPYANNYGHRFMVWRSSAALLAAVIPYVRRPSAMLLMAAEQ